MRGEHGGGDQNGAGGFTSRAAAALLRGKRGHECRTYRVISLMEGISGTCSPPASFLWSCMIYGSCDTIMFFLCEVIFFFLLQNVPRQGNNL